ncbi:MAG TPA: transcription antitermination factor NusB [Tepidisphaeraceae bacterium]|nr:transcription antitermination factor NusB [Tepidisphaeraceae bacterium]
MHSPQRYTSHSHMAQPRKSKIRELAMQILFLWDTQSSSDVGMARQVLADATDDPELREAALEMATAAWEHRQTADRWVERVAPQWPPYRQPAVDRNVLRMAVWELVNTSTPPKVVIDEAIELAKHFSTEQSASFVNGVMDAILKEHRALTGSSQ